MAWSAGWRIREEILDNGTDQSAAVSWFEVYITNDDGREAVFTTLDCYSHDTIAESVAYANWVTTSMNEAEALAVISGGEPCYPDCVYVPPLTGADADEDGDGDIQF
jgi:hypothetical protein